MKALECSHHFSHLKSMGIFSDAQGQLTTLSKVGSGQILISSETLWLSSLPARMKTIQSNIKALECSEHYTYIFQTLRVGNYVISGRIWLKSKRVNPSKLLCMSLIPARMKKIQSKKKALECSQHVSHYKSKRIFPDAQGQLTPQSMV